MPIASVTKPMVGTVVMRLVERGRLALDESVASHVPELASSDWGNSATIRQLLANTSGVPLRQGREYAFPEDGPDAFALYAADLAADQPLTPPGQVWGYQNTGWNLLGRVIEVATEASWEDAMRSELFEPLEMSSTRFYHEGHILLPSERYEIRDGKRERVGPWANRANGPGGAGLWSSALDLIRFVRPHVESDAYAVLREVSASPPLPNFLDDWCLGMARFRYEGGPVWGWDGIGPGHRAVLRFLPGRGAIALLTNTSSGRDLYRSLFPVLFDRLFGVTMRPPFPPTDTVSGTPIDHFAGTYSWLDRSLVAAVSDGNMTLSQGEESVTTRRLGDATFALDPDRPADSSLTFAGFDETGRPQILYYLVWPFPRSA
jgi:CubicO group peptidase (beta-lactamase class C family)